MAGLETAPCFLSSANELGFEAYRTTSSLPAVSGGTAKVTVGSSVLDANAFGIQATGGAGLLSYGNNQVTGNASNGSFTGIAGLH